MAKFYRIRPGDNLISIARGGGCTVPEILALNPSIANPNLIRAGETILLPDRASRDNIFLETALAMQPGQEPTWLKIARQELGVSEIAGPDANPYIVEYLSTTPLDTGGDSDETPWCSSFANWCLKAAGIVGTNSAWALKWRDWGRPSNPPTVGALAVFSRTGANVAGGHVGFFLEDLGGEVRVLGGNQGNRVSIADFPKDGMRGGLHYRLIGYRVP